MKNGTRPATLGGLALAGALALTACGTDDNSAGGTANAAADCVKATVNAAGSTAQANAVSEWTKGYQASCPGANVNYNANGSGAGIQAFTQGRVAFAGSDSALKPEERGPADRRCRAGRAVDLPMVVGPIAVAYNLRGVGGLQLSPKTIASIFAGKIKSWNDPAIARDNPRATLPQTPVKAIHRADDSGTTENFARFLAATAPDVWTATPGKKWPASAGGQGATRSDGVATVVRQTEGAVSYVEMSYAAGGRLQTARVANGSGRFVELSPRTASRAVGGAQVVGQGNDLALKIDYRTREGYPIVLVSYEIVCEKGLPSEQARFVRSYLTYAASRPGQSALTGLGYAPLPDTIAARVRTVVQALS